MDDFVIPLMTWQHCVKLHVFAAYAEYVLRYLGCL